MFKFIKVLFIFAFVISFGYIINTHPGEIEINWLGYQINTSVAFAIFSILLLMLALYIIKIPFSFLGWIKKKYNQKKEDRKNALLLNILVSLANDSPHEKEKLARKVDDYFDSRWALLLKTLLMPSVKLYQELYQNPQTHLAGLRGILEDYEKNGDLATALDLAEKETKTYPKLPWLMAKLFRLQILNNDLKGAETTNENLYRQQVISKNLYLKQKSIFLYSNGQFTEAFELSPNIPIFAIKAAVQKPSKAEKILLKAYKITPSWEIYQAYISLFNDKKPAVIYKKAQKLISENPNNRLSLLIEADSAQKALMWNEASMKLDAYHQMYRPTKRSAQMMVDLSTATHQPPTVIEKWEKEVQNAPDFHPYTCQDCEHSFEDWMPICPVCQNIGGIECVPV